MEWTFASFQVGISLHQGQGCALLIYFFLMVCASLFIWHTEDGFLWRSEYWSLRCDREISRFLMGRLGVVRCKWVLEPMHWLFCSSSVISQGSWMGKVHEEISNKCWEERSITWIQDGTCYFQQKKSREKNNITCVLWIRIRLIALLIWGIYVLKTAVCFCFEREHLGTIAQGVPNLWVKNIPWSC